MVRGYATLLSVVIFYGAASAVAQAQELPTWLRVRAGYAGELEVSAGSSAGEAASRAPGAATQTPSAPLYISDREARVLQNRGRRILAAGAGMVLSAAITPAYVLPNREPCWGSEHKKGGPPLLGAAVVGGIGLALVAGGATWLGIESRRHGLRTSKRRERLIDFGIGALTFVLSQAALASVFVADQICNT